MTRSPFLVERVGFGQQGESGVLDGIAVQRAADTERVGDLRRRVRDAMEVAPLGWDCPESLDEVFARETARDAADAAAAPAGEAAP